MSARLMADTLTPPVVVMLPLSCAPYVVWMSLCTYDSPRLDALLPRVTLRVPATPTTLSPPTASLNSLV